MTEGEIRRLIDQAAEKGAACALRRVGLSDQDAGRDVRELRELLVAWRDIRKTARRTVVILRIAFWYIAHSSLTHATGSYGDRSPSPSTYSRDAPPNP